MKKIMHTAKITYIIAILSLLIIISCATDKETTRLSSQANCVSAGQISPDKTIPCCPGLTRNFVAEYHPEKSCEELSENSVRAGTIYYICTACGNKTCESWENRCNCPQDCKFP